MRKLIFAAIAAIFAYIPIVANAVETVIAPVFCLTKEALLEAAKIGREQGSDAAMAYLNDPETPCYFLNQPVSLEVVAREPGPVQKNGGLTDVVEVIMPSGGSLNGRDLGGTHAFVLQKAKGNAA